MRKLMFNIPPLIVMLMLSSFFSFAQTKPISGVVRDSKGSPLAAATVAVKNSKVSSTTDADGKFSINLPPGAKTLVISFVGMQPTEIAVGNKISLNITLQDASATLGDVVVIAYGTVRRKDLTGAVSDIKGADLVKANPTNIVSAMQGKLAGV